MSAHLALQEAALAALAADADIKSLIGDPARVYDDVPRTPVFPYVTIGEGSETDWSAQSGEGVECRLILNVWSRYAGRREVKRILARIRAVLHDADLSLTGWRLINLRNETLEFARGPGGGTYYGLIRFRATIEAA